MAVTSSAIEASKKRTQLQQQNATISPTDQTGQRFEQPATMGTVNEISPTPGQTPMTSGPTNPGVVTASKPTSAPMNKISNGSGLKNADINYSQYGDDSSAKNQGQAGGLNEKYTGEGVLNSNINYDPNAKLNNLDPSYKFGMAGQYANSDSAGYLARRNDQIASALYNEGLTSKEDVVYYLGSQEGWNNSTEADRVNTVESIWKRLGEIAKQNEQSNAQQPESNQTPESQNNNDLSQAEKDFNKDTSGKLYGRTTAQGGDPLNGMNTLADRTTAAAVSQQAQLNNLKSLQSMNSYDIAVSMVSGYDPYGAQAWRDLNQYDRAKAMEVEQYMKQIQGEEAVNNIATNGTTNTQSQTQKATESVNNSIDTWTKQNSTSRTYDQVQGILTDKLATSQTAQTATQEMLNLNMQMAEIQERMDNLPQEAQKAFKGDVPQYIVDAYVTNNSQRLQSEMNKLQSRYNAAIELYKTEVQQKQWETEIDLKERQLNADINYQNWQMYNGNQKLALQNKQLSLDAQQQYWNQGYLTEKLRYDNITEINGKSYIPDGKGGWTNISTELTKTAYQNTVNEKLSAYNQMFADGSDGGQCEEFTDAFTYSTTGLKMEGADGRSYTTAAEKQGYVNTWIPEVGSVAVFDYGIVQSDGVNYGHTMLVTGYDPNTGIVTLRGSNKSKKPEEYEKVYTQTMTLSELNSKGAFKGFWNPYLDKYEQSFNDDSAISGTVQYNPYYTRANTPMTAVIEDIKANASTAAQKEQIAIGEQMYNTLYELESQGYLDKMVESGVLQDFLQAADREKFGKQGDDKGSAFLNFLGQYIRNEIKDEDVAYAFNRMYALVEQKLRQESGAAISSSERQMDFQLFLPRPGQSEALRRKTLQQWDDIIYREFSGTGMPSYQYVPIFDYSGTEGLASGGSSRQTW